MPCNDLGPPEREEPGLTPKTGPNQKLVDTTTNQPKPTAQPRQCDSDTIAGLSRRRQAARRLPRLSDCCGASDALSCRCYEPDPPLSERAIEAWRAAIERTLPIGTPVVPVEVLQRLHRMGGTDRQLAQRVWADSGGVLA
jgi:hypothetical protein